MKNVEIIAMAKAANNLPEELEVNTLPGWNRAGKKVKSGEKALFSTKIWKPKTKKTPKLDEDGEPIEESTNGRMYLVKAYFFSEEQVV